MTRGNVSFENPFGHIVAKKARTHIDRLKVVIREARSRGVITDDDHDDCMCKLKEILECLSTNP